MKKWITYGMIFCGMLLLFMGLLMGAALLPREAIQKNAASSAAFFNQQSLFQQMVEGKNQTKIDHYADCILLGIGYSLEPEHPLRSIMEAAYYDEETQNVNESFYQAVNEGKKANTSYARYWHGSLCYIMPLLMVMDIQGIYIFNAVVMLLLLGAIMWILIRKKYKALAIALLAALVLTGSFYVPICIEYSTTYLVTLAVLLILLTGHMHSDEKLYKLFFVTGMVTVFLDFLTTETLTLTLPLIFILCIRKEEGSLRGAKKEAQFAIKAAVLWGIGYTAAWAAKWCLSSLILQENIFAQAAGSIDERTLGFSNMNLLSQMLLAIVRNVSLLFPLNLASSLGGILAVLFIIAVLLSGIFVIYGKKKMDKGIVLLMCAIGCVPYLRYMVLSSHAYIHYFFTYRAQLTLVLALTYLWIERMDFHFLKKQR